MASSHEQTDTEWSTDPTSYELSCKIGQGAFAIVWKAKTTDNRECAVKILNLDHVDTNLSEIRLEVQAMRLLSHPNVLTCYTAFVHDTNLWLLTPLMSKGSSLHGLQTARKLLRQRNQKPHMEDHILYIIRETLVGLQYIHDNGQIHRDIKAGNILLDGNGDVRIADFGVSGWLIHGGAQHEKAKTFVGTPCWMAPEVMEQVHGYDYKADIWSLGITSLELARGYAPYAKFSPMKVLILTIQEDPPSLDSYTDDDDDPTFDEEYSRSFRNLAQLCLAKNPAKRPTCQELLQSRFLSSMSDPVHRQLRRDAMRMEVCGLVPDVGSGTNANKSTKSNLPGNVPVSIILSQEKGRPPGTTWVFADGSQILSSQATAATVDEVLDELEEFGKRTAGENYARLPHQPFNAINDEDETETDDISKFMDEFEQNTAGEDFRHPSNS